MSYCSRFALFGLFGLALFLTPVMGTAHPADENPDLTLPETTREFRQDRFGMYIHWGVSSVLVDGESVMKDRGLSVPDYERLAQFFNPSDFNPAEWVRLAKSAGMRYIVFTCKQRDGFAMWDSRISNWNVVKRTPFARDVVKELAEECRRENIKLFVSYSPVDWHHSELVGPMAGGRSGGDRDGFTTASVAFANAQIRELLSTYGKIDGVWLDGWWDHPEAAAQLPRTYELIRKLQPAALIGNSHSRNPLPGEDFQRRPRLAAPEVETEGSAGDLAYSSVPVEVSDTINRSRGFRLTDHQYQSTRELVHSLVSAAGMDANLLLNVGPMPDGRIQPEFAERLRRVGMWLAKNGDSIYATRGGPMAPQAWGVTTHRGKRIYVHVLDAETTAVELQIPSRLRSARYFNDESDVAFESSETTAALTLRPERRGEMERLIVLETARYQ